MIPSVLGGCGSPISIRTFDSWPHIATKDFQEPIRPLTRALAVSLVGSSLIVGDDSRKLISPFLLYLSSAGIQLSDWIFVHLHIHDVLVYIDQ